MSGFDLGIPEIRWLLGMTPWGPIALVTFVLAIGAAIALFVASLVERTNPSSRIVRRFFGFMLGFFSVGSIAASRLIAWAHRLIVDPPPPPPGAKIHMPWTMGIETSETTWMLIGLTLVPIAFFSGVAALLRARHIRRPLATAFVGAAGLAMMTSLSIIHHVKASQLGPPPPQPIPSRASTIAMLIHRNMMVSTREKTGLVAIGAVIAVLVLVFVWRDRKAREQSGEDRDPEASLAIGAGLFALGLEAWIGTRGMAYDAGHILPDEDERAVLCDTLTGPAAPAPPPSALPVAIRCQERFDGPIVDIGSGAWHVNGTRVEPLDNLTDYLLQRMERSDVLPYKGPLEPIIIRAPAEAKTEALLPALEAILDVGVSFHYIVTALPERHVATATLGDIHMSRHCCPQPVRLADPKGAAITDFPTWGDVARAAADGKHFRLP